MMASILCNNCNTGIHYHSEPQGIEYTYISTKDWNDICNSHFKSESKEYDDSGYPKLYRTDTLEDDFSHCINKSWKCPSCGSILAFDKKGSLIAIYVPSEESYMGELISEGLVFDDYLWEKIVSSKKPDIKLKDQIPSAYIRIYQNGLSASTDQFFSHSVFYICQTLDGNV